MTNYDFKHWIGLPFDEENENSIFNCRLSEITVDLPDFPNMHARVDKLTMENGLPCIEFVEQYGQTETGNIVLLTKEVLQKYLHLQSYIVRIYQTNDSNTENLADTSSSLASSGDTSSIQASSIQECSGDVSSGDVSSSQASSSQTSASDEHGQLMGFLLTLPLQYRFLNSEKGIDIINKMLVTTYLTIHRDYRNKGLAMLAIRRCIKLGQELNVSFGYQMVQKKLFNARPLTVWYRPLNYKRAETLGYDLHNFRRLHDRNQNQRNRLAFNTRIPPTCSIRQIKQDKELTFYLNLSKHKSGECLYWWPEKEEWANWLQFAPTYMVLRKKGKRSNATEIIGFFSYISQTVKIARSNKIGHCAQITWFVGDKDVLKCAIHQSSKKHDVLQLYTYNKQESEYFDKLKMIQGTANIHMLFVNIQNNPESIQIPYW